MGNITWIQNHKAGGTYATETYSYSVTTGNMASKAGVGYAYNDPEHTHAVTHLDGVQKYWYDLNGNMTTRIVDGNTYNLAGACPERREGTPRAFW